MLSSKWGNLSRCFTKLILICKQLSLALDCGQTKYSLEKFDIYIYTYIYSILGMAFAVPFLCYFQKLQLLVIKKSWNNFWCIVLLFVWAQNACLRFLKSYFKLDILIVLYFLVPSIKLFFCRKNISGEIWDTIIEKLSKFNMGEY